MLLLFFDTNGSPLMASYCNCSCNNWGIMFDIDINHRISNQLHTYIPEIASKRSNNLEFPCSYSTLPVELPNRTVRIVSPALCPPILLYSSYQTIFQEHSHQNESERLYIWQLLHRKLSSMKWNKEYHLKFILFKFVPIYLCKAYQKIPYVVILVEMAKHKLFSSNKALVSLLLNIHYFLMCALSKKSFSIK